MIAAALKATLALLPDGGIRAVVGAGFSRTAAGLRAACADPAAAQEARLQQILQTNAGTVVGRQLDFAGVRSLADWRQRAPLVDWDDVAPLVDRMVAGERGLLVDEDPIFYATTSGTTGRRKLIPVTSSFVGECRVANRVLYRTMLLAMPGLLRGKRLSMRSPRVEALSPRASCGSITVALGGGVDDDNVLDAVPAAVFALPDFAARYAVALRFALQERVTVASAINPSTLALFAETLATRADDLARACDDGDLGPDDALLGGAAVDDTTRAALRGRLRRAPDAARRVRDSAAAFGRARMRDAFPALGGLVTWKGGSSSWWLHRLVDSYGDVPVLDYGYAASEGCFGAPLWTDGPAGVRDAGAASVLLPHGHVVELLPEGETEGTRAVGLHEAEPGHRYSVVVTTGAGLYRYRMHDVVEIVGRHDRAPLAVFRHKTGTMCSITGEKLGEAHVARALAALAWDGAGVCLAPRLRHDGAPAYLCVVDGADDVDDGFAARLDAALCAANEEYEAKRRSLRLGPLAVARAPRGAFTALRRRRVEAGAPDAHVKLPLLSPDGAQLVALGIDDDDARGLPCRGHR